MTRRATLIKRVSHGRHDSTRQYSTRQRRAQICAPRADLRAAHEFQRAPRADLRAARRSARGAQICASRVSDHTGTRKDSRDGTVCHRIYMKWSKKIIKKFLQKIYKKVFIKLDYIQLLGVIAFFGFL